MYTHTYVYGLLACLFFHCTAGAALFLPCHASSCCDVFPIVFIALLESLFALTLSLLFFFLSLSRVRLWAQWL